MAGFKSFFNVAFGSTTGFMCVASRRTQGKFTEHFYAYPEDVDNAIAFIKSKALLENVYFCPQLLKTKQRTKENVVLACSIWADLDECSPTKLKIIPSICLETSPKRYQALWALDQPASPQDAEAVSRKIAYFHSDEGSDRSGWDLTQLLRLPGTYNHKYHNADGAPQVTVASWDDAIVYSIDEFDVYPQVEGYEYLDIPFPENMILEKGEDILDRYRFRLNGAIFTSFHRAPESDRSTALFRLEMYCLEAGMNLNESFQVARDSACNKFEDREIDLWKDICRAKSRFDDNLKITSGPPEDEISLLSAKEQIIVDGLAPTFIDRYVAWARSVGDAAEQYHIAGGFVALSSMLAGAIQLPTSFGTIAPNLWFLLLADTTLTRKSTAMDLAMDIVMQIDEDILMATDGSLEGLMTALSARSNMPSVFLRDEFTGLIDQMHKKDYLAGMPEFLAKIYDGKTQKRLLRKEEIKVTNPRLIVFGGGIKSKMMRIVHSDLVESGFLPRFVVVTAMSDVSKVKPLGPPRSDTMEGRDTIMNELKNIAKRFPGQIPAVRDGKVIGVVRQATDIRMSERAWLRYNELDQTLTEIGLDSGDLAESLVPMNARLSVSILKCAMLLATSRSQDHPVEIQYEDLLKAASFGDSWRRYAQDIIVNVGKSELEGKIGLILRAIQKKGSAPRSRLMQSYHLTAREMTEIEKTLEARGLITVGGMGRAVTYNALVGLCKSDKNHSNREQEGRSKWHVVSQSSAAGSTVSRCSTICSTVTKRSRPSLSTTDRSTRRNSTRHV